MNYLTILDRVITALGWGLLSQFSPFRYFPYFPLLSKQTLAIEYHVYIWQVLPQLSCGDTCQIWMWFRESNRYFRNIENFAYGEISERSFSNPHPWTVIWLAGFNFHLIICLISYWLIGSISVYYPSGFKVYKTNLINWQLIWKGDLIIYVLQNIFWYKTLKQLWVCLPLFY